MLKSKLGLSEEDYEKLRRRRLTYLHKFIETAFAPCEVCNLRDIKNEKTT